MGWIPGKPAPCSCGLGDTSRSHLMVCTLVPSALWCCLPVPPTGYVGHHIVPDTNMYNYSLDEEHEL
ncbi:hypothetical protein G6F33_013950 [Rhizopus arrhizus]|nr:hypothetical protein G6F33_013950 [Rhizopus arrhizus]